MVGSDKVDAGVRPGDILAGKYRVERGDGDPFQR
jgi:hypothetical protein